MSNMLVFNPVQLIEEVQKRPGLYKPDHPSDREEKLALWKEIGAVIFHDWDTCNKATAYDRVLQIQRKWRSLRDAYNRELRARRSGIRINRRTYRYFKRMSFLGGFEGLVSDGDESDCDYQTSIIMDAPEIEDEPPIETVKVKKNKKKKRKRDPSPSLPPDEVEMSMFPMEIATEETDSDKLFLLSFLPEMRQLPVHIKMWARAQIANIMQEAVSSHYNNVKPGTSQDKDAIDIKRQRLDSTE